MEDQSSNKKPVIRPGGGGPAFQPAPYGSTNSTSDLEVKKLKQEV